MNQDFTAQGIRALRSSEAHSSGGRLWSACGAGTGIVAQRTGQPDILHSESSGRIIGPCFAVVRAGEFFGRGCSDHYCVVPRVRYFWLIAEPSRISSVALRTTSSPACKLPDTSITSPSLAPFTTLTHSALPF